MFNFFNKKTPKHIVEIYNLDSDSDDYILVAKKEVSKDILEKLRNANCVRTYKVSYDINKVAYYFEEDITALYINTTWTANNTKVTWYHRDWFFPEIA